LIKEIEILAEILEVIRDIFRKSTNIEPRLFLIGMKALYYYFGTEAFSPAPISLDIDINFDILVDWTNYRKLIPQQIKEALLFLIILLRHSTGSNFSRFQIHSRFIQKFFKVIELTIQFF